MLKNSSDSEHEKSAFSIVFERNFRPPLREHVPEIGSVRGRKATGSDVKDSTTKMLEAICHMEIRRVLRTCIAFFHVFELIC